MNLDRVIAVRNAKTIYRDGDQCVKVFNENYSKADILNEALNQARIEGIGLHVPKILGVTMIEGKWAILSEFIQGKTLSQLMKEDPDNKSKYLNMFVDLQMEVQSKTCPMLNRLKDKMSRKLIWMPPRAMICLPAWKACLSITKCAMAISGPPTLSSVRTAPPTSLTGAM